MLVLIMFVMHINDIDADIGMKSYVNIFADDSKNHGIMKKNSHARN